ncbi:MAG: oligosaccharide biosynthesis protein Alg14 [Duncaniella sp.]|nr:oligosaccharide biosynthesis protein Alg14 [Duncaniella sp.]MDE7145568.1 oligosaccharide biosynthesis protein Alg14 [Duncaniella sp.]
MTILAVASLGGHWTQLLRITSGLGLKHDIIYMSTHPDCAKAVAGNNFFLMDDFSRWNPFKSFSAFFSALRCLRACKPDAVVTTGAAPGLIALIAARITGVKTIWIDSIANPSSLSLSGKIASRIATATYTQWENLACGNVKYAGNVLGD